MSWYIVRTATRRENRAEASLIEAGFDAYLPRMVRWQWGARSGRKQRVDSPLFTGYLFVAVHPPERFDLIRASDGVHAILNRDGHPGAVSAGLVEALRAAEIRGDFDKTRNQPHEGPYRPGEAVAVIKGHYADWPAKVLSMVGEKRVKVLLTAFGGQHEQTLDVGALKAA